MTATVEHTQSDLPRLVNLVQQGEEVVITSQVRAVARLRAFPQNAPSPKTRKQGAQPACPALSQR